MTGSPGPLAADARLAGVRIRDVADADGPALAALIAGIFLDYEDCPFLPGEFPELAAPATAFAGRGGRFWVAEADGTVMGSLAVVPSWRSGEAELFKVYVDRAWRGRGVARALMALAFDQARAWGVVRIGLWSDIRFVEGHAFYRRVGFRQTPGCRALHDAGRTLEFAFERELAQGA